MHALSFDIQSLRQGYLSGAFTVAQVIDEALRRIESADPKIWISIDTRSRLLAQAEALQSKDPDALPLYGIPFAVKDNIDVAELPTTAACPEYRYFAQKDATVVAHLRAAGAIPIGKTNLDQFATGLVGVRTPYGTPGNSFDPDYIPGGSSAGSAVSVALGQASFSLGTDTAGSGRVPACFNNLVGLKPSRGLLSNTGAVPACKSLDCISLFALNAADAQAAFRVAAEYDSSDPYSRALPTELDTLSKVHKPGLSFGVPEPTQLRFFGNEAYQELYLQAVKRMETLGYRSQVVDIQPLLDAALLLYEGPWVAERYWAIQDLVDNRPDILHPTTRAIISKGKDYSAVKTFDSIYKLQAVKQVADRLWGDIDFLLSPTAGTHYTIGELEERPIELNSNLGYYTNYLNLLDLSGIAVPTGFTPKGMPFGVTLVAPAFHDELLIQLADKLHRASKLPLGASERRVHPELKPVVYESEAIAVCGAHLSGLPLNHQLSDRGATLEKTTQTAAAYRLFALPDTSPPKPGLIRDESKGAAIEIEVWNLPKTQWASFIAGIPAPLGIGSIELADGATVKGFICEAQATTGAKELTELGSWRRHISRGA